MINVALFCSLLLSWRCSFGMWYVSKSPQIQIHVILETELGPSVDKALVENKDYFRP